MSLAVLALPRLEPLQFLRARVWSIISLALCIVCGVLYSPVSLATFAVNQRVQAANSHNSRSELSGGSTAVFSATYCTVPLGTLGTVLQGPQWGYISGTPANNYNWYQIAWDGGICSLYGWSAEVNGNVVAASTSIAATLYSQGCASISIAGAQTLKLFNASYTLIGSGSSPATFSTLTSGATYFIEGWHTNSTLNQPELWGFAQVVAPATVSICRTYPAAYSSIYLFNSSLGQTQSLGVTVGNGSSMSVVVPVTNYRGNQLQSRVRLTVDRDGVSVPTNTSAPQYVLPSGGTSNFTIPIGSSLPAGTYYAVIYVETDTNGTGVYSVTDSWSRAPLFSVQPPNGTLSYTITGGLANSSARLYANSCAGTFLQSVSGASGTFTGLANGTYCVEAYNVNSSYYPSAISEYWGNTTANVVGGSGNATIGRIEPRGTTFLFMDPNTNQQITNSVAGAPVKVRATVYNPGTTPRGVQAFFDMRTTTNPAALTSCSSPNLNVGGFATVTLECTFTPSVAGTWQRQFRVTDNVSANTPNSDSWPFSLTDVLTVTQPPNGTLSYTIAGGLANSSAKLYANTCAGTVLQSVSGASGTFTDLVNGTYCVEAYNLNSSYYPSAVSEYWGNKSATVAGGSGSVTINRTEPFATLFQFLDANTNQQITSSVVGASVKARATVYNPGTTQRGVQALFGLRTTADLAAVNSCPSLTVNVSAGATATLECTFTPSVAGTWQRQFRITDNVSANTPNSDSWPFSLTDVLTVGAFPSLQISGVQVAVGNSTATIGPWSAVRGQKLKFTVTVHDQNNQPVIGANVCVSVVATSNRCTTTSDSLGNYTVATSVPLAYKIGMNSDHLVTASNSGYLSATQTASIQTSEPEYGLTVVIHGFQPPSDCESEGAPPPLDFVQIGSTILRRAGKGRLWDFNYQSDLMRLLEDRDGVADGVSSLAPGEDIVVVNWCDVSNNASPGHGEAVAHALYTALRTFNPDPSIQNYHNVGNGLLKNAKRIHIIAHSFGASIAFELSKRLAKLAGQSDIQVTTLDPHDFAQPSVSATVDAFVRQPNVDWSRIPEISSGSFDDFYQLLTSYYPHGRCVDLAKSKRLDNIFSQSGLTLPLCLASEHTLVHRYYLATIDPDKSDFSCVNLDWFSQTNRFDLGYATSRLGGLLDYSPSEYSDSATGCQWPDPFADVEVMDGSNYPFDDLRIFDGGFSPLLVDGTNRPGYRGRTGTQYWDDGTQTVIIAGNAFLPQGRYLETHLTYIGPTVQSLRFKPTVRGAYYFDYQSGVQFYVPWAASTGQVTLSLGKPNAASIANTTYTPIGVFQIQGSPIGTTASYCYPVPPEFQGWASNIRIQATGDGAVSIDELELRTSTCADVYGLTVRSKRSGIETGGTTFVVSPPASDGSSSITSNASQPATVFYDRATPPTQVVVTAPASDSGGNPFSNWAYCDIAAGRDCTVTMSQHRGIEANYNSLQPVNGVCGPANGMVLGSAPSVGLLCAVGSATSISGTGPWTWTCNGLNGGSNASCSAQLADTVPDAFVFTSQTNVALSALITSNTVTITGINAAAPISVTNGTYNVNGGGFTSATGTVNNGNTVSVQLVSSTSDSTQVCATLTIGGVSGQFCATTQGLFPTAPSAPTAVSATAGDASIAVSFGPPVSDGGAAITGYSATCSSSDGGVSTSNTGGASATSIQIGGLTNGKSYTCTVTASNAVGAGTPSVPSNTVIPAVTPGVPVITSAGIASGMVNQLFNYQITATNNPTTYGWSGSLPAWLSVNPSTGLVSGTPTASGTVSITVTATNAGGMGSKVVTITTGYPAGGIGLIAAGNLHTCALTMAGGLTCWGHNGYGQLGDTTTAERHVPVGVAGLTSGVAAVAARFNHTCALTAAGGLKCWGDNNSGQLGDNTTTNSAVPVDVLGLTSGVAAVAVGANHTCALTTAGGVKCWGKNSGGQLGDNTTTERHVPEDVLGLTSGIVAVAVGFNHACAVTMGGALKCWGQNNFHQAGGPSVDVNLLAPADVLGLATGVAAVAAGWNHTCALTTAGGLKCWGNGTYGQLGNGNVTNTSGTMTPVDVVGLTNSVAVSAGGNHHTCAVTTGGALKCWGRNQFGQLGDTTTTNRSAPVDVSTLSTGVAAVAAGYPHTCALTTAGGVKCWGGNNVGQLGDNTIIDRLAPVDVSNVNSVGPDAPTIGAATAGNASISVAYTPGALGSGTLISNTADCGGITSTGISSPITVTGLTNGTSYTCRVMTTTTVGTSTWSESSNLVTPHAVTLIPMTMPNGTVGTVFVTQNLEASGGVSPYTYAVTLGSLPGGLALTSAGVLSGTPNVGGIFNFTVTATDSSGAGVGGPFNGNRAYSITIDQGNTTIDGVCGIANGQVFVTAPTTNLCAAGIPSPVVGAGPWTWTCSGVYGGNSASCSANLRTWTVTPSAGAGGTISPSTGVTVNHGATTTFIVTPNFGYSALVGGTCGGTLTGTTYTTNVITANCTVSASFTTNPVSGVCGSSNGGSFTVMPTANLCSSGTPSVVSGIGPWSWSCIGSSGGANSNCSADKTNQPLPVIISADAASGTVNQAFSYQITATNNPASYGLSGSLPAWLSVNAGTGLVSGTPLASGTFSLTVTATNAGGTSSMTVSVVIIGIGDVVIVSSGSSSGGSWIGNSWTPSATASTVLVSEIVSHLAIGTTVINTTGSGDIVLNGAMNWSSNNILSLIAARDIKVNANINATGNTAGLVLGFGTGRSHTLANGTSITLSGASPTLRIGVAGSEDSYTVINSLGVAGDTSGTTLQGVNGNLTRKYALGVNIDAMASSGWNAGAGFSPIATTVPNSILDFQGIFDGLGHTINGLVINRPTQTDVGLFRTIWSTGVIRNLMFTNLSILGASGGGLASWNLGRIDNVNIDGAVTSTTQGAGGLVNRNDGTIDQSSTAGIVTSANGSAGGLVSFHLGAITNSFSTANVSSTSFVGGLVSQNSGGNISTSYATGNVSGSSLVGGLVGIAGPNSGPSAGTITNVFATGQVSATGTSAGGLVGVNGFGGVGATIINAYATGRISGSGNVGGLIGSNSGVVINAYWDTQASGQTIGFGSGATAGATAIGLTTLQTITQSSFVGFDFINTWRINEGITRPLLRNVTNPLIGGASPLILTVTTGGAGNGAVTSNSPSVNCGIDCTETYASTTAVTLTATPAIGSVFMGWLGACIGTGPCNVNVTAAMNVSATFAPNTVLPRVDIDGNNSYDALTDGLLMIRYLFGLTGSSLTNGAIGTGYARTTPDEIAEYMDNIKPLMDVDGNGQTDALTDGLILIRYMFGLTGPALTAGAIGNGATRTAAQIEAYIQSVMPQ